MFFGYDNMTVCSGPIQLKRLITHPNKQHDTSTILARACRLHFERRYKDIIGPRLPNRAALINELLESPNIEAAINEVMRETGKNHTEIKNQAYQMLDEIVSNISYHLIRCLGAILHLVWNKLYQAYRCMEPKECVSLSTQGMKSFISHATVATWITF